MSILIPVGMAIYSSVSLCFWLEPPAHAGLAIGFMTSVLFLTWWRSLCD